MAGAPRETEGGDGLGRLVFVRRQKVVQTLVADRSHEPFTGKVNGVLVKPSCLPNSRPAPAEPPTPPQLPKKALMGYSLLHGGDSHIRTRQAVEGVEAEAGILDEDGALDGVGGGATLLDGDLVDGALDLGQVEGLAAHLDGGLEDGLDLGQLVGVAADKVYDRGRRHVVWVFDPVL